VKKKYKNNYTRERAAVEKKISDNVLLNLLNCHLSILTFLEPIFEMERKKMVLINIVVKW
jgi:hypothetical protein